MKRLGIIILTAALAVTLTACGGISKSVDLKYGETYKIEDAKLAGKENLTWESEDSRIVSVSDDGTVTATAPGKAKVSIKDGEKSPFTDVVAEELKKGEKIQLVGFGTFEVSERAAREGRNPQTGEAMTIAASKTPKFKAGKALKDSIN